MTTERGALYAMSTTEHTMLAALLIAAAAVRVWLGWDEVGIYWPDEIYQSVEPAQRLAFGYGLRAWEFIDGARNWTFPALIAVVLKVADAFGADAPEQYLRLLRMLFSGLGVLTAWGVYRLALVYRAPPALALAGAALFAFSAVSLYFSHRAMAEVASMPLLVWGFVLLLGEHRSQRTLWLIVGASLLGLSALIRLQNGLFCIGALATMLGRRQWRESACVFVVLCAWAFALGFIDKLTWGAWFQSAIRYIAFNVVEGRAAEWGVAPFSYYGRVALTAMPGPALVLLVTMPFALVRAAGPVLTCVAFVLLLAITPHKEFRFVVPVLPLMFAMAAVGAAVLAEMVRTRMVTTVLAMALTIVAVHSGLRAPALTFGELGVLDKRGNLSAWGYSGAVNRLLLAAHRQADLCGLKVEAVHMAWAGGQSYFHRPVNLYAHNGPPREAGLFNYVIASPLAAGVAQVVAADEPYVLARLPNGTCLPDPHYSDRLP